MLKLRFAQVAVLTARRARQFVPVALVLLALYLTINQRPGQLMQTTVQAARYEQPRQAVPVAEPSPSPEPNIIARIFGGRPHIGPPDESGTARVIRALISFALAALLATCLAFRPRKNLPILQRNPFVVQTQILLAVVGAALMIVVSDNAARAFGIFATASLIRFRTNIRDPKEITVLLISLAIGLASGIGHWEIAMVLTGFILLILWPLEHFEMNNAVRAMELKVKSNNLVETDAALKRIFKKRRISAELRKLAPEAEKDPHGEILYYLNLNPEISLDRLSEEIFAATAAHIESIQWEQKKSASYMYN
jgi:hypothetical protein